MVDSPMVSRYRLLTRNDSMRIISSRRAMSFGCFIVVSILFTLLLFLNPSIYQLSPRIRNAFQSSRRYAFSKVFAQIFSNASFAPPPSVPPTNTHHHDKSELPPEAASAPSPCQVSRKVVPRLLPKERLRNRDCSYQSGWHLHPPSEENDRGHAPSPQEASLSAWPPSPTASPNEKHWMEEWSGCDVYEGSWVRDDSYPLYSAGSCPYIHGSFNCFANGRIDNMYEKYRWQPKNCKVPRLKGDDMLEMLRGKRLVFVGDSLNRNMWESLVCVLRNSLKDKSRMFAASDEGEEFLPEGSDSIIFKDYNSSVEYYRSPFLVQEWETPDVKGSTKETLRLDMVERSCDKYKDADVLIFNTGHWWTHTKLTEGKSYYQEGNLIHGQMSVEEAFHKAILTWSHWVDTSVDRKKTTVFFRGYSPSHFRDGEWDSGGHCDNETEPMKNESEFTERPPMMDSVESVLKKMKTPVFYLNITKMTDFRVDAHPSWFRRENMNEKTKKIMHTHQDCSHWCLPGVPDFWNELLYAHLLYNINRDKDKPPK